MLTTVGVLVTLMTGLMTTDAPENFTASVSEHPKYPRKGYYPSNTLLEFTIAVAVIGMMANALVLIALLFSKHGRGTTVNALITNQIVLDLCACALLTIGAVLEDQVVALGVGGMVMCFLISNHVLVGTVGRGSEIGLIIITLERYVKVVHPIFHRKHYRSWMTRVAVAIPWVEAIIISLIPGFATTRLSSTAGCVAHVKESDVYGFITLSLHTITPLVLMVICYSQILAVVRRQAKVKPTTNKSTAEAKALNKREKNVIKTMLIVSICFAVCIIPYRIYNILAFKYRVIKLDRATFFALLGLSYMNRSLNPFIYGTQYSAVTKWWYLAGRMIKTCKKVDSADVAEGTSAHPVDNPQPKTSSSRKMTSNV